MGHDAELRAVAWFTYDQWSAFAMPLNHGRARIDPRDTELMSLAWTRPVGGIGSAAGGCLVLALPATAWAGEGLNLASRAAPIGSGVRDFQVLVFAFCAAVAIAVLAAMIWSTVHHRKSRAAGPGRAPGAKAEIAWTVLPIAIFVAMAVPAADGLLRGQEARPDEFSVKVTGYQWKWEYEYLDLGVRYSSLRGPRSAPAEPLLASLDGDAAGTDRRDIDRPLVVPAGVRVRVQLTSNDVNHAWWIREFGRQRNAIPGHINEFTFRARKPGIYRGECTEFCGPPETCVPIVVEAVPAEEFEAWRRALAPETQVAVPGQMRAATAEPDLAELIAQGRMLHARNCAGCHQASGMGLRAAGFPPLAGTQVSKDEHIRVAVHGRKGSAMAGFGPLLGDEELAAIVTYQRNAWGNDSGDVVDPADIAAVR
jgi:cytochrome c oxidase subunit II